MVATDGRSARSLRLDFLFPWGIGHKKAPRLRGFCKRGGVCALGFVDLAGFDRLDTDPHTLDFAAWEFDAYALYVGTEATLGVFNQAGTDTAALFGKTFTDDASAFNGSLACDCANSCHGKFLLFSESGGK